MTDKELAAISSIASKLREKTIRIADCRTRDSLLIADETLSLARRLEGIVRYRTCEHEWKIDGAHSNEYCGKCYMSKGQFDD